MGKEYVGKIPFDKNGNLLDYAESWLVAQMIDNFQFEDTLQYDGYSRGRSSAKICFKSATTGKKYEMFLTDFDDLMNCRGFDKNTITGTWTFCKRGQNYGIKLVI